jgi:hypothetical protein
MSETLDASVSTPLNPNLFGSTIDLGFSPSKIDPSTLASQIARLVRSGVRNEIEAYVLFDEGERAYKGDPELAERFLQGLVLENLIPRRSARLGLDASKASMLRKIGQNADVLLDDRVFKHLRPGRSLLYHVILLHEALPGTESEKFEKIAELFEAEGQISRKFLIDQTKLAEQSKEPPKDGTPDPWEKDFHEPIDLVFVDLDKRDARKLNEVHQGLEEPRWARVHEVISKEAVAIVHARVSDLPVIEDKLLSRCGFGSISKVLLVHDPLEPDVTDAEIVVVAVNGSDDRAHCSEFSWSANGEAIDPVLLAERLVPDSSGRLELFAKAQRDGWLCIVGDANWSADND